MNTLPVSIFKTRLGRQGNVLEIGKVRLEAIENGSGKAQGSLHGADYTPLLQAVGYQRPTINNDGLPRHSRTGIAQHQ